MSVCLSIYLPIYLPVYLSTYIYFLYNFTAQISHDFTFAHGRHVVVVLVAVVVQCRGVFCVEVWRRGGRGGRGEEVVLVLAVMILCL